MVDLTSTTPRARAPSRQWLLLGTVLCLAAPQSAVAAEGGRIGVANGVSISKSEGTRYDLRLADFQVCYFLCARVTPARFRTGGGGDYGRHLRMNASREFDIGQLDPSSAGSAAGYSWSFLNAGLGFTAIGGRYDSPVLIPYYQAEWWTENGTQLRHLLGLELALFDDGPGGSLQLEWEKQADHSALNINLLVGAGEFGGGAPDFDGGEGFAVGVSNGVSVSSDQGVRYDLRLLDFQFGSVLMGRITPVRYIHGGDDSAYNWSFLNAGVGISPSDEVVMMPYYQTEWWTPDGFQARHLVGLEFGFFDGGGASLNLEWEKQAEHQALNVNLLVALGYMPDP